MSLSLCFHLNETIESSKNVSVLNIIYKSMLVEYQLVPHTYLACHSGSVHWPQPSRNLYLLPVELHR